MNTPNPCRPLVSSRPGDGRTGRSTSSNLLHCLRRFLFDEVRSPTRTAPLSLLVLAAIGFGVLPGLGPPGAQAQEAPTYYVNLANATPVFPYTSWATAATNLQDAVNAGTAAGRLVLVTNGVYRTGAAEVNGTNRVALTDVVLRSVNGPEVTVIDGAAAVRCVYLGANSILSGFTLRNGSGGGVAAVTSGVVTNCVLTGNWADCGGGAYGGTLYNCTLTDNSADVGGGTYESTLYNCTLTGNSAGHGGGAYGAVLYNCTLTGNSAQKGGGVVSGVLYNCLVYFNRANEGANWCSFWDSVFGPVWVAPHFEYSCTTPMPLGPGNISADPQLVSATHLASTSPCLGAGNPAWVAGMDIDGEPWAAPPAMGADQVWPGQCLGPVALDLHASFTETAAVFPVSFTAHITGRICKSVWDFGDGTVITNQPSISHAWTAPGRYTVQLTGYNDTHPDGVTTSVQVEVIEAVHYVNVANTTPVFPYTSWATAATNLQDAVNAGTVTGRLVLVTNGVYRTGTVEAEGSNRVALTNVVLRSVNGPEVTIIEGSQRDPETGAGSDVRCAYMDNGAVLTGFTLQNGGAGDWPTDNGGGVFSESSGVVTNCVLTGNSAGYGGGAYGATLYNCNLIGNAARGPAGGSFCGGGAYGGTLYNCTLTDNSAGAGGGAYESTLSNCTLTGNVADHGGGAHESILSNCTLTGNSAGMGGGARDCTLYNCRLTGNAAIGEIGWGGGAYGGMFYNCTLTGNTARRGGGAVCGFLYNCLVYFNQAEVGANWGYGCCGFCQGPHFEYSCTTPLPPGVGNTDADPRLGSVAHLSANSSCLGAGNPAWATGVDIDGEPWATPPAMGADQLWPGQSLGPLTLEIHAPFTEAAVGFPVSFTADGTGPITGSVWDFGDGTVVTNQPFTSHAWTVPGAYTVRLTGYNDTHPDGIITSVQVEVIEAVHYVNVANTTPGFPYTSWATAATNLQDAVNAGTVTGRLVLVTNGVYRTGTVEAEGANRVALTDVVLRSVNGPEVTVIDGAAAVRCVYLGANSILSGFTLRNGSGGGVAAVTSGVVTNCVLAYNSGRGASGGILYSCTLTGNSGGGASESTLYNCTLTNNYSAAHGGGAYGGTLYNCTLTDNSGVGAYESTLYNCTLTGNSGGGVSGGTLFNCIVCFNPGGNWSNATFEHSCTTPLPPGPGNTDANPGFMNREAGDFRLCYGSPCIDAGAALESLRTADLDGLPRSLDGNGDGVPILDMGAYEFDLRTVVPTDWFAQHGLDASDPYVLSGNPDADGQTSFQEWLAGTDPRDARSFFRIEAVDVGPPVKLSYQSLTGRGYTLYAAPALGGDATLWTPVPGQVAVPGSGGLDSLSDTNAAPPSFYRLGVDLR